MKHAWGLVVIWVLALLFALNTGREWAYNVLYFITGVIGVTLIWAWANLRGLTLKRGSRIQRSQVGRYFEESLELVNGSRWPKLWVELDDLSDLPGHQVSRVVNSLGGRASSRWQVRTLCQQRGRYSLGPVVLTSGDPVGIFRFTRSLLDTTSLVVSPATIPIPGFTPPIGYLPGGEVMHRRTPYITASVSGVRDYAPGDSFNRIHWRSTARTGRMMSKEFELDPLADVWIFLDMHRDAHAAAPWTPQTSGPLFWTSRKTEQRIELPPSTVEYGVTIAASLAQHFLHMDREVGFLSYPKRRELVQPDRGERQLTRMLEVLAVAQAEGTVPVTQMLAGDGTHLTRQSTLIVITASTDTKWITALRGLRSRGVQGIGVFLAASTFGPAPEWSGTVADLQASGMPAYLVKRGDDLPAALSQPISGSGRKSNGVWAPRSAI
ncbi:MAG: DUF58 domain-containing protein [Anaerolineae bacterium]|nr:DUF58 domain-containing protein [Anaerolineae bacterium]